MTLSSGKRFRVENGSIVNELKPTLEVRELVINSCEGENIHITREDGLKILQTSTRFKCLYPDGTLITTTYGCEHLTPLTISKTMTSLSLLDEIWLSEAEKSSQIVLDEVVQTIGSDYFLCMKENFQFEHKFYGLIRFNDDCEMELYNGTRIVMKTNNCSILISMKSGVLLQLSEMQLKFYDEKCCECDR